MNLIATSCLPKSNCITGLIELQVNREEIPKITAIPLALLGGTLFYPLTFAVMTFAQVYFSLHMAYCRYKKRACDKKIQQLESYSDAQVRKVAELRFKKLRKRLKGQKIDREEVLAKWVVKEDFEASSVQEENNALVDLYNEYLAHIEGKKKKGISVTLEETIRMGVLEKSIRKVRKCDRTVFEIRRLQQASVGNLRYLLTKRYECAKIRYGIAQAVDIHYMKTAAKFQIPVIGVLLVLKDPKTTRDVLERDVLVDDYNSAVSENPWLKPYGQSAN